MATLDEHIAGLDPDQQAIAVALRAILDSALPAATGQVWHAHPVWLADGTPVAGFKAYPRYVTFMIWNAAPITDSTGTLESGARMSTVKFASLDDVDESAVREWLAQSAA